MSCERYRDAIVDHACGAEIAADAAAHLDACTVCQQTFRDQALAIDSLDRELQAALAIEPSRHFVSETLVRAQGSVRARRHVTWWLASAAAAAIVIVTFGLLRVNEPQPEVRHESAVAVSAPKSPAPIIELAAPDQVRDPAPSPKPSIDRAATPPVVEVIVPPDQSEALSRYLAMVRRGALAPPPAAPNAEAEAAITDPVIAPLSVAPLNVAEMTGETGAAIERRGPQSERRVDGNQ